MPLLRARRHVAASAPRMGVGDWWPWNRSHPGSYMPVKSNPRLYLDSLLNGTVNQRDQLRQPSVLHKAGVSVEDESGRPTGAVSQSKVDLSKLRPGHLHGVEPLDIGPPNRTARYDSTVHKLVGRHHGHGTWTTLVPCGVPDGRPTCADTAPASTARWALADDDDAGARRGGGADTRAFGRNGRGGGGRRRRAGGL